MLLLRAERRFLAAPQEEVVIDTEKLGTCNSNLKWRRIY